MMIQESDRASMVQISRDEKGVARELLHIDQRYLSQARTPLLATGVQGRRGSCVCGSREGDGLAHITERAGD
jgi:hypothetical protein